MGINRSKFLQFLLYTILSLLMIPARAFADMVPRVFKGRKQTLPVTPTPEFYVEDYAGPPKSLRQGLAHWRLKVRGKVDHPLVLDINQLLSRPSVKRMITLNCIGINVS